MEHQLWTAIVAVVAALDKPPARRRLTYTDAEVVGVFYWAVVHDRPVAWAVRRENWPLHLRRRRRPSNAAMSRRLRTPSVRALLAALERRVTAPAEPGVFWAIDGKSLPIGGCSKDRQAGYGRSAGGKAKGYKLHAIAGLRGIAEWRLAPMNKDERVMAARMLKSPHVQGYVVADSNYDSNPLHAICDALGDRRLVAPRRYGPGFGLGRHKHAPGRLRSVAITEAPFPAFARRLLADRAAIERRFGQLTNWGGGLTALPAWVRTYPRVHRWVQAKLALAAVKLAGPSTTCAA
jgi:hypothetical protein